MRFRHGVFRAPCQGPGTPPPLGPARAGPPSSALPPAPPAGQRPISEPPALEPPSPAAPVAQLCSDGLSSSLNSAWSLPWRPGAFNTQILTGSARLPYSRHQGRKIRRLSPRWIAVR